MSFLVLYYYQFQDYHFFLLQAYQHLGEVDIPKFTVIVAQKNHHTKLFQAGGGTENVPPGLTLSHTVYFNVLHGARCVYSLTLSFSPQGQLLTQRLFILETMISTCVLMQA
jgi:hypothetical protein